MKTLFKIPSIVIALSFAIPGFAVAQTIAYWRFEPGNVLTDSSGNGLTLTASGSAAGVALPASGAGAFPNPIPQTGAANTGIANVNASGSADYFSVADNDTLFDFGTNAFTVEGYITASDEGFQSFAQQLGASGNFAWRLFANNTGSVGMNLWKDGTNILGGTSGGMAVTGGIADGENFYIGAVMEPGVLNGGADGRITFYVKNLTDDLSLQTGSITATGYSDLFNSSADVIVGANNENNEVSYVDELRITNGALSSSQLLAIPEPAAISVLFPAMFLMLLRRRRRVRA